MDYNFKNLTPFPKDFLWGASSSAYQCEGAYLEDGKGLSVADVSKIPAGTTDFKDGVDHYHRFREDISLMAAMGLNEYRFSISWTRIIPDGDGEINPLGVQHYHEVLNECHRYSIEPVVTLYHFDLPLELQKKYGGWADRRCIDAFERYARICFKEYGDKVKYFLTINEQNIMILYQGAQYGSEKNKWQANHNMLLAQAKAINACHELAPNSKIAPAPNISAIYPASSSPEDYQAAMDYDQIRNRLFLDTCIFGEYPESLFKWWEDRGVAPDIEEGDMELLASAKPDFIAFNYYSAGTVRYADEDEDFMVGIVSFPGMARVVQNDLQQLNSYGMGVDPIGLRVTLRQLWDRYHLPLIITENGYGNRDILEADGTIHDTGRIDYLRRHIIACREAITDGVQLFGYSPWSAFDLISTHQGVTKRYGLIYVDRDEFDLKEMRRIPKDSFFWYKKVIKSNGEDLD